MTNQEFDDLRARINAGTASAQEAAKFTAYATELRVAMIDSIDREDRWDEEWPQLAYNRYDDDSPDTHDDIRAWEEKNR